MSLEPGESVELVLYIATTDADYSFALFGDVYFGNCENAGAYLGDHRRMRVYLQKINTGG